MTTIKEEFQSNQHVFYIKEKVKAIVKGINDADGRVMISFFPHGKDKRISKLVDRKYLTQWKSFEDRKKNPINNKSKTYVNKDNRYYNQVREFHLSFGQPAPNTPTRLTEERKQSRIKWMQEELDEYRESDTLFDDVDGLIDLIYFAIGTLVEHGVKPDPIMDIVNNANMSKLWSDGMPRFRDGDGKIIKPENWIAPEPLIQKEILRQIEASQG